MSPSYTPDSNADDANNTVDLQISLAALKLEQCKLVKRQQVASDQITAQVQAKAALTKCVSNS